MTEYDDCDITSAGAEKARYDMTHDSCVPIAQVEALKGASRRLIDTVSEAKHDYKCAMWESSPCDCGYSKLDIAAAQLAAALAAIKTQP